MILHRATKFITPQITLGFGQLTAVELVERQMDFVKMVGNQENWWV
jgi:hypothetical protein